MEAFPRQAVPRRAFACAVLLGLLAVCAHGLWRPSLWKSAEPRVMDIARDQYTEGLARSLTFGGLPFLEEPPLAYDLSAAAFHVAGGPSVLAARAVIALLGLLWLASIVLLVRRAAGSDAALLAGALLVVSTAFTGIVRRLGVDAALIAFLALSLACLYRAIEGDAPRLHARWWWASLAALGCAALTKGVFASFLFVAPTLAYALLARDRRVLVALFSPLSLFAFFLPHVVWGVVLYRSGGMTYVFEHFVNNTLGRVVHTRFEVAGAGSLAYGDVGVRYPWYYCLRDVPVSALPGVLAVPFALAAQRRRGGLRARDPVSRLTCLALCWACVPALLLSFSAYKGRDHLGLSSAALVVIAAPWLARALAARERGAPPRGALLAVMGLCVLAPLLVVAACFGLPATERGAHLLAGAVAVTLAGALVGALRARSPTLAVYALLAALGVGYVLDFSPGAKLGDEADNTMDSVARLVAQQAGDDPVAVYWPRGHAEPDTIGRATEQAFGSLTWWLGRPVVALASRAQVSVFLDADVPGYVVACRGRSAGLDWPQGEAGAGWQVSDGPPDNEWLLVANRAAAARRAPPPARVAPPAARAPPP